MNEVLRQENFLTFADVAIENYYIRVRGIS